MADRSMRFASANEVERLKTLRQNIRQLEASYLERAHSLVWAEESLRMERRLRPMPEVPPAILPVVQLGMFDAEN